jgi:hypothetical protein
MVNERVRTEERGRTCDDDDDGGERGSFATGMRLRPRSVNPREDENETRRKRTHTGAEEVARTYHDAGRIRTDGGAMGSRRRRSVACARTLAKWARLRTEAN